MTEGHNVCEQMTEGNNVCEQMTEGHINVTETTQLRGINSIRLGRRYVARQMKKTGNLETEVYPFIPGII